MVLWRGSKLCMRRRRGRIRHEVESILHPLSTRVCCRVCLLPAVDSAYTVDSAVDSAYTVDSAVDSAYTVDSAVDSTYSWTLRSDCGMGRLCFVPTYQAF